MKNYDRKSKIKKFKIPLVVIAILLIFIISYAFIPHISEQGFLYLNKFNSLELRTFSVILIVLFILNVIRKKVNLRK